MMSARFSFPTLATDIVEDLRTVLAQSEEIEEDLKKI